MTNYRIIDKQEPGSKFFISSGLDDWSLKHHEDLLKMEKHLMQNQACELIAIECLGDESIE